MQSIFGGNIFWNFSNLKFNFLTKKCLIFFFTIVGYFCPLFFYFISPIIMGLKFLFNRGYYRVIFMTSQWGEFKELLISRNLLEIEPNGVHFWRLYFLELFEAKVQFFDKKLFDIFLHHSGVFCTLFFYFISPIIIDLKFHF